MNKYVSDQSGIATLIALLLVAMLTLIGLAAISNSDDDIKIAGNELQEMRAFYAAESGLELAAAHLTNHYDSVNSPPSVLPAGTEDLNDCRLYFTVQDVGPSQIKRLTTGSLAGLHSMTKEFKVSSVGESQIENARVLLTQKYEVSLVPIFQFAVFYENDLEIAPGPHMTLGGRVHSNSGMFLQSGDGLDIDGFVTAAGSIYHGRKGPGGASDADVSIKDAYGDYQSMKDGLGWLDASESNWYDSSTARWLGRVQDAAHGQQKLQLPLSGASHDPHLLIERAATSKDSYENKATLKIVDGKAMAKVGGVWTDVTASLSAGGVLSHSDNLFYDGREATSVDATRLDVQKLYDSPYAPSNGVIYFADNTSDYPALRLENGNELDQGLTVASQNPVYTLGDFNSVNKKPAALIADAVTFLSSSWDDTKGALATSDRIPVATTVNAAFLTGNTETTDIDYNGGLENLPRFLEDWSGVKFTLRGSMVNLWNSRQAVSKWGGGYYSPPIRDWSYDVDFDDPSNLPPESPVVKVHSRTGWQQEFVGAIVEGT